MDMKKNYKQSKTLWGSKVRKELNEFAKSYTYSFPFDYKLYEEDIGQSIAHVQMLEKGKLIKHKEKKKFLNVLKNLKKEISQQIKLNKFKTNKDYEDIHTYIEKKVTEQLGDVIGTKLHTARSRNDQVSADTRLYIRKNGVGVAGLLTELIHTIHNLAEKHKYIIMPAYTHMQLAKPVYFRDYIRAYSEMFKRDMLRIENCLGRLNFCPLGSGAVGGTHYRTINRKFIAKELEFSDYIKNTVDAVSDRDFVLEYLFVLSMIMMHISRLSEDFVMWSSPQFKFITIDESFMTGSSILPQKNNPDVCELARGKTGRVYGNLLGFLTVMKGLPMSYNRDMQEDKEALFDSNDTVITTLKVYIELLKKLKITDRNKENMMNAIKVSKGFANAPRYVDYLVEKGYSLRNAYEFVSRLVHYCTLNDLDFDKLEDSHIDEFINNESKIDRKSIKYLRQYSKKSGIRNFIKTGLRACSFNNYLRTGSRKRHTTLGNSAVSDVNKQLTQERKEIRNIFKQIQHTYSTRLP